MKNQLKRPLAVVFDTDNTLYPYDFPHKAALEAVARKASLMLGVSRDRFISAFRRAREETKKRLEHTASSHSRLLYFQRTIEILTGKTQLLFTLDLEQTYWRTFLSRCVLFPGLLDFLEVLKKEGVATAIVTDLTSQIQFRKIIYFDLEQYFNYVVTSEESGLDKPDLLPFRLILEKLNIPPRDIWMIGDSAGNDVRGAKRAGMFAIQKLHAGVKKGTGESRADYYFRNYSQILSVFRKLVARD